MDEKLLLKAVVLAGEDVYKRQGYRAYRYAVPGACCVVRLVLHISKGCRSKIRPAAGRI